MERLMRTELARVQTEAQKQSFERNGFEMYQFICNVNPTKHGTCPVCQRLANQDKGLGKGVYLVADMMPGTNAPPMHPHCRCSTAAYEDDAEYEAWLDYLDKGGTTAEWNELKQNGRKFALDKTPKSGILALEDIVIAKSVGAKAKNYEVMDLSTGEMFHFVEGTKIQNVEVFAGKGAKSPYRKAYVYANEYGGKIEDWQHVKGFGWLETPEGDRHAEVHWSQCEGIGKHDFFVKRWLDE
jgi:SPP1 gp7 family putative phage head morphogenesis protein